MQRLTLDSRWLAGPDFLCQDQEHWPLQEAPAPLPSNEEEQEQGEEVLVSTTGKEGSDDPNPAKYSSWLKLRRVVAWVKRFTRNVKARLSGQLDKLTGQLSSSEVKARSMAHGSRAGRKLQGREKMSGETASPANLKSSSPTDSHP